MMESIRHDQASEKPRRKGVPASILHCFSGRLSSLQNNLRQHMQELDQLLKQADAHEVMLREVFPDEDDYFRFLSGGEASQKVEQAKEEVLGLVQKLKSAIVKAIETRTSQQEMEL